MKFKNRQKLNKVISTTHQKKQKQKQKPRNRESMKVEA